MNFESIFKWILGVGLDTPGIQSTLQGEGKYARSRPHTNIQLSTGYRLQDTNQHPSLQNTRDAKDAGYKKDTKDTG